MNCVGCDKVLDGVHGDFCVACYAAQEWFESREADALAIAMKALEYYANPKSKNNLEVGERSEFGCMCCTGTEQEDGLDFDRSVVGLTAREAIAAIKVRLGERPGATPTEGK